MVRSLLIANRGEIACRVIRTARRAGVRTIAVYSEADEKAMHVAAADEAVPLGPADPARSYRNIDAILAAAKRTGARAVHPGYGFLSESADFARAVIDAGLVWVGPPPAAIEAMGDKVNARNLMAGAGVPVAPGCGEPVTEVPAAVAAATRIGYPVMIKATAGGGGMGMDNAADEVALVTAVQRLSGIADKLFGSSDLLIERYFPAVRHVEVQILGQPDGRVVALTERDCSVQRRNQKLVEETPSAAVSPSLRRCLLTAAERAGMAVGYRGAGTVEFLLDTASGEYYFLEMNTRLQVEHPITEAIHGIDLVDAQLRIADGQTADVDDATTTGHAIELRVNAEDPKRFLPGPGTITTWREPRGEGIRVDAGYREGDTVPRFYDSLMAKLIVHRPGRSAAIEAARRAVADFVIAGPKSNLAFHAELLDHPDFVSGDYDTGIVGRMRST